MHIKSGAKIQKFLHIRKRVRYLMYKNREIPKNLSAFITFAYSPYSLIALGEAVRYITSLVHQ